MTSERLRQIQDLFYSALDVPVDERPAYLDAACGVDRELRDAVERYLRADAEMEADSFLADSPIAAAFSDGFDEELAARAASSSAPDQIGPYRVLRPLGRGGMGDVYLAVRDTPFRRYVALKVIRRGTNSHDSHARFAVERQILASLNHPGIARLFDGGVTDDGRPYFAMEYVDGQPITAYCNERQLSIEERLRLFLDVCAAVHYAHQNLVLHRDLKPSNILVTARVGEPASVRLLDFGIAKLLNPQMSHLPVAVTREAQRLLTPEYASPEHIRGEQLTTASDVYALGVLLYELLAGRRPHRLDGRSVHEMIQIVSGETTPSPSTVVLDAPEVSGPEVSGPEAGPSGPTEPAPAANRRLTAEQLRRRLRGDLDAICLKALRKDPDGRYGSAQLLAEDVRRHLAREPVLARRGSRRYRAAVFLRRHRLGVGMAAIVVLALATGLGAALWQAREAAAERDRAEQVATFMMDLLGDFDPNRAEGGVLDLGELLDLAVKRIEENLDAQPAVQARLYTHIGKLYHVNARQSDAEVLHRRALALRRALHGETHTDVAESLNFVAWARFVQGAHREADSLYTRALAIQDRLSDPDLVTHTATLNELALVRRALGDNEGGLELAHEAYTIRREALGEDDPVVVTALNDLAAMHFSMGRHDEAARLFEQVVAQRRRLIGTTLETAQALNDYGAVLTAQEDYEGASRAHNEALAIRRSILGDDHPQVAQSLSQLGWALQTQGRYAEAEPLYREALAIRREHFGEHHTAVGNSMLMLGEVLTARNDVDGGLRMGARAVEIFRTVLGSDHRTTLVVELRHAKALHQAGREAEARALVARCLPGLREVLGPDHDRTTEAEALLRQVTSDFK